MTTDPRVIAQLPEMLSRPMKTPLVAVGDAVSNRSAAPKLGYFTSIGLSAPGEWSVLATWILPSAMDEDPGSINCGCPLVGRSHAHAERTYVDYEAARTAWAAAKIECHMRLPASFAPSVRIGG